MQHRQAGRRLRVHTLPKVVRAPSSCLFLSLCSTANYYCCVAVSIRLDSECPFPAALVSTTLNSINPFVFHSTQLKARPPGARDDGTYGWDSSLWMRSWGFSRRWSRPLSFRRSPRCAKQTVDVFVAAPAPGPGWSWEGFLESLALLSRPSAIVPHCPALYRKPQMAERR